jgi:hypothetical protein
MRLTIKIYTDASGPTLAEGMAALPSLGGESPNLADNRPLRIINNWNNDSRRVAPQMLPFGCSD